MTPQEALAMINNSEKKEAAKTIETTKKKAVTNDTPEPVEKTPVPTPTIERPSLDNSPEKPAVNNETGLQFISRIMDGDINEEDITEAIYREYTRSILSSTPFTYPFTLFDGSLTVTFREAPYLIADQYSELLRKIADSDPIYRSKLALLTFIDFVEIKNKDYMLKGIKEYPAEWFDCSVAELELAIKTSYLEAFGELNETIHRCLPMLWFTFNALLKKLISEGLPQSF